MDVTTPVTVLGAGTMGRGIALTIARGGHDVLLVDLDPGQLDTARAWAAEFLAGGVRRGKLEQGAANATFARLATSTDLGDAAVSSLVVEALPESLDLKQRVLAGIQERASHDVTIHTNTSTLSIGAIADGVPDPTRVIGTHYCNPAPIMPLIEIARGDLTSDATVEGALAFAASIGKQGVVLKDRPGLITNFLVVAFENDAVRALESGLATAEEIDRVVVESMRFPIGPFRLLDIVGLDVHVAVSQSLLVQLDDGQYAVPQTIHAMVERGDLGVKTGRGFYDYDKATT